MQKRFSIHLLSFGVLATALGLCFLREPLLGDDVTYWSTALAVHENGLSAWGAQSFYDLRWPVWGVCWLLQTFGLAGLFSFWGEPILYLAAGAALVFLLSRCLTSSCLFAFCAGLAFIFHPFLDPVCFAPMPDLSEAVWGAAVMLTWWQTMHAPDVRRAWLWASATGLFVFVLEANRVTGIFLVPVLIVCTVLFFRARFRWLLAAGFVALLFYLAECFFYHHLFGDWLHDLTANTLNRAAKGTEFENPWLLPFRFLDSFWHDPLVRLYSLCALAGMWLAWRGRETFPRVLALWCVLLLLEYSCAPQSLRPIRPLVRDAPRFLASLAIPMSLLAIFALRELQQRLQARLFFSRIVSHWLAPIFLGVGLLAFFFLSTERKLFHPGFIPEMRRYLASVHDHATVFTHASMRDLVRLVSPRDAARFRWLTHGEILERDPALEAEAASADEFWYEHKLSWLGVTQRLNKNPDAPVPQLASYFVEPETNWKLTRVLLKENSPELVFYRKRRDASAPQTLAVNVVPTLPAVWERGHTRLRPKTIWQIPEECRGRLVRLEMEAASDQVDSFDVRLRFFSGARRPKKPIVLHPYIMRQRDLDFFALTIPEDSTACEIELRFAERTQRVEFSWFRAVMEDSPAP
ncbi:MAG: hypothetical protein M3R10_04330 [Verrucomicrobiota bacterium]|nr:hypothetical protein [Verrucomicrobiota bacterium]